MVISGREWPTFSPWHSTLPMTCICLWSLCWMHCSSPPALSLWMNQGKYRLELTLTSRSLSHQIGPESIWDLPHMCRRWKVCWWEGWARRGQAPFSDQQIQTGILHRSDKLCFCRYPNVDTVCMPACCLDVWLCRHSTVLCLWRNRSVSQIALN